MVIPKIQNELNGGNAKMVDLSQNEAKRVFWRYWDLSNSLPEEEKNIPFPEWLYFKGFRLRTRENNIVFSSKAVSHLYEVYLSCPPHGKNFFDWMYESFGFHLSHPSSNWEEEIKESN